MFVHQRGPIRGGEAEAGKPTRSSVVLRRSRARSKNRRRSDSDTSAARASLRLSLPPATQPTQSSSPAAAGRGLALKSCLCSNFVMEEEEKRGTDRDKGNFTAHQIPLLVTTRGVMGGDGGKTQRRERAEETGRVAVAVREIHSDCRRLPE